MHFCISFNQEKDQVEVLERQNNYFCIVRRIVLKLSNKAVEIRKKKMVICNCVITKYENRYLEDFIFEYDTFESFMRLRNSSESRNSYIFCLKINKKIKKQKMIDCNPRPPNCRNFPLENWYSRVFQLR